MKRYAPLIVLSCTIVLASSAVAQYLTSAKLYLRQREYAQAEASALKAVAKDSTDEEAWYVLGQIRYELRKYPEMIQAFEKAAAIDPKEHATEIHSYRMKVWADSYNAGIKYYNKGRDTASYFAVAVDSFKTAILAQPDSALTYYVCALALYANGQRDEAIATLYRGLEKKAAFPDALSLLGRLHMQSARAKLDQQDTAGAQQEYARAAVAFEKLYDLDRTDVANVMSLLEVYEKAKMDDKALNLTKNCADADPKNRLCRYAYGLYLIKKEQYEQGIKELETMLAIDPTAKDELYKDAMYNLGVAYQNWGVALKAISDKKVEESKGKIKEDLTYKEKFKSALASFQKVEELKKDDPALYQALGKLYATLNMPKEAEAAFKTADRLMNEGK
jgi:tetratricopeptide (TPR) repeat protein